MYRTCSIARAFDTVLLLNNKVPNPVSAARVKGLSQQQQDHSDVSKASFPQSLLLTDGGAVMEHVCIAV